MYMSAFRYNCIIHFSVHGNANNHILGVKTFLSEKPPIQTLELDIRIKMMLLKMIRFRRRSTADSKRDRHTTSTKEMKITMESHINSKKNLANKLTKHV